MGNSPSHGNQPPEFDRTFPHFVHFVEVSPGFWNYRTDFHVSVLNIKTHMSVTRLSNGELVAIDAAVLTAGAKAELDELLAAQG